MNDVIPCALVRRHHREGLGVQLDPYKREKTFHSMPLECYQCLLHSESKLVVDLQVPHLVQEVLLLQPLPKIRKMHSQIITRNLFNPIMFEGKCKLLSGQKLKKLKLIYSLINMANVDSFDECRFSRETL